MHKPDASRAERASKKSMAGKLSAILGSFRLAESLVSTRTAWLRATFRFRQLPLG